MKFKLGNFFKNFTLFIFSIIISIYLIEFAYSLYQVSGFKANKWSNLGRSKFDEYVKLKKTNQKLTVTTPPHFLLDKRKITKKIFPLSGISDRLTINCNESGYFSKYYSDRYGFNNKDEIWDKKVELLLVGDSFTHGACVNYPDTFVGNFNLKYNSLSLGYGGNGPLIELGTIKEYINLIKPKKVIWIFSETNDLEGIIKEYKHPILKKYLKEENFTQHLPKKQNFINNIQNEVFEKEFNSFASKKNKFLNFDNYKLKDVIYLKNLKNLIRWRLKIDLAEEEKVKEENFLVFNDVIYEANRVVKKYDAELFFVFLPFYQGLSEKDSKRFQNYQKVINIVKKQQIKIIDLQELMFDKSDDPKSFFPGRIHGHYTEYGYKIASEIILKNISN